MQIIALILMAIGGIGALIFAIQLLIMAFKESILWGLGSLFIPFVILVFVIMNWQATKTPFLRYIGCLVLTVIGAVLGGASGIPTQ